MNRNPGRRAQAPLVLLGLATTVLICSGARPAAARPIWSAEEPVTIGIVRDNDNQATTAAAASIQDEIAALLEGEFTPRFDPSRQLVGDGTLAMARALLGKLLIDPEVDLIVCIGYVSSTAACHYGAPLTKPVLAPFALDAHLQGLQPVRAGSGIDNLNYLSAPDVGNIGYETLSNLLTVRRLALLAPAAMAEVNPDHREAVLAQLPRLDDFAFVPLEPDLAATIAAIPEDTDAVVVLTITLDRVEVTRLAELLIERGLPSFSYLGHQDIELGFLSGMVSGSKLERLSRRTALAVQRILLGDDPATLPVMFVLDTRLGIDMQTARALEISPPWDLRLEADLIGDAPDPATERLDLAGAIETALLKNRDLAARGEAIAAGREEIGRARAFLLPQLHVGARGTIIDRDRAEASFGSQAERTYGATVDASQLLYSDAARANHTIQQHLQNSREAELRSFELDVILQTALAYLNVLKANTVEDIRLQNLQLTRSNLELARQRDDVGVAAPAEVYRWDAEVSLRRRELITANSQRNQAEIELNRLLDRGLEDPFVLADVGLNDPSLVLDGDWLAENLPNAGVFKRLRIWIVEEAQGNAPELAAFDAALAAQRRRLVATGRAFWLPDVSLRGSYERILDRQGAGVGGLSLDLPGVDFPDPADDTNWSVVLGASLPLFEGGGLRAERRQAQAQLAQLEREREAVAQRVAQAARSAYHAAGATFANIRHARAGAEAARKTLQLVTDAYARGAADLLDLLDAQNAALVADLVAANAVYDFLIDSMRTQRALGRFDAELTPSERDAVRARIEAYLNDE